MRYFDEMRSKACRGAHFSKVRKSFRARKAITKILNLMFTELFFSHNFNIRTKLTSMQSLMPMYCFLFEIQKKNGFMGPISYRVFRETGPSFFSSSLNKHNARDQRNNASVWSNRPAWVHRILVQFLPYYMLNFRTPLLRSTSITAVSWLFLKGDHP